MIPFDIGRGIILSGEKIDTTPDGQFKAHLDAALAQRERGIIGLRTAEGMAQKKREGWPKGPAGRTVSDDFLDTYRRVLEMSKTMSLNGIAKALNADDVPTAKGGTWYASTVRAIVTSETAKSL